MKKIRDLLMLIAIFGLCWWIFSLWQPFNSEDGSKLVSIEQEEQLAELLMGAMEEDPSWKINKAYPDSVLNQIADRLLDSLGFTDYDYQFYLVESPSINAFAMPGAHIVVFTGLMEFAENPEDVASVLAHEIGHVEERHVIDRLVQEFSIAVILSVFGGGDAILLKDILNTLISSKFSRGQEEEADDFGLRLMEKSGIDPSHMGSFFKRLDRNSDQLGVELEMIMSHPALNSRVKKAYQYKTADQFEEKEMEIDWEKVKLSLNPESSGL
jgi:predicted Zn-dependent protease